MLLFYTWFFANATHGLRLLTKRDFYRAEIIYFTIFTSCAGLSDIIS